MNIDELQGVLSLAFGFFSASARPRQTHPAAPPACKRDVMRQNDKAEREHPEAEHGKEPEQAASDEGQTQADPCCSRPRESKLSVCDLDFTLRDLEIGHRVFRIRCSPCDRHSFHSVAWPQSSFQIGCFSGLSRFSRRFFKKPLGKSAKRLYYAANPPQGDDPW